MAAASSASSPVLGSAARSPADATAPAALLLTELGYSHDRAFTLGSLAEATGRYGDMFAVATDLARRKSAERAVLRPDERGMLAVAAKNRLTSYRGCLKMLSLVAEHEADAQHLAAVQGYAREMEAHVLSLATELLSLALEHTLPVCDAVFERLRPLPASAARLRASAAAAGAEAASSGSSSASADATTFAEAVDALVWWHKLCGDYCRYVSECHTSPATVARHSDLSLSFYSKARQYGQYLHPAAPTSLGVTLNFTVFLFEIRRCETEAFEIAKAALEEAAAALAADDALAGGSVARPSAEPRTYAALTADERVESDAVVSLINENLCSYAALVAG